LFIRQLSTTTLRNEGESSYSLAIHNLGSCGDKCLSSRSGGFTLGREREYIVQGRPQSRRGNVEKKNTSFAGNRTVHPPNLFTLTVGNKFVILVYMNFMLQRFKW